MKKHRDWELIFILSIAAVMRLLFLDLRPTHFDEGIVGWWVDQVIANGYYAYDPLNYHGPLPYYFEFFSKIIFGRSLWALRLPSVAFGMGAVYFLSRMKDFLGKHVAYGAALLMAVSPAMVFYSRYTPNEIGLLFFSVMTCYGYLRFIEWRDKPSLWYLGLGFVGMATTKETFIINVVCFALAILCLNIYERIFKYRSSPLAVSKHYSYQDLFEVVFVSLLFFVVLYSGVFLHWWGVVDFFQAFVNWGKTSTKGSGHDKPFWYWLENFKRYEMAAFLGFIWCLKVLDPLWWPPVNRPADRTGRWVRLFAISGMGTLLAYSIIPYKTPWCIIQLLWPFYIILASGFVEIASYGKKAKSVAIGILMILVVSEGALAVRLTFFHSSDDTEPYVYVQTYPEIEEVMGKLHVLTKADVNNYHMDIKIYKEDTWPLPWLLAEFTRVSWMGHNGTDNPDAPLIIADIEMRKAVEDHIKKTYYYKIFRLRSAQGESVVYYDTDKFKNNFDATAPVVFAKPAKVTP